MGEGQGVFHNDRNRDGKRNRAGKKCPCLLLQGSTATVYLSFFMVFEKFNYRTLSYFEIIVVVARQRYYVKPGLSRLS